MHKVVQYNEGDIVWVEFQEDKWWPGMVAGEQVTEALRAHNERNGIGVLLVKKNPTYQLVDESMLLDFKDNFEKVFNENEDKEFRAAVDIAKVGDVEFPPFVLPPKRRRASIPNFCKENVPKRRSSVKIKRETEEIITDAPNNKVILNDKIAEPEVPYEVSSAEEACKKPLDEGIGEDDKSVEAIPKEEAELTSEDAIAGKIEVEDVQNDEEVSHEVNEDDLVPGVLVSDVVDSGDVEAKEPEEIRSEEMLD